ncbi:MAG: pilus assembly protein PilM [Planctomycetaceae bacterium]|nr:pilus assembly protein PilM [Planctomycetaceae bacterium]
MSIITRSLMQQFRRPSRVGWIGVDIGSHSVKLAQLEIVNGRKQIAEAAVIYRDESTANIVEWLSSGTLSKGIRLILSQNRRFRGRDVACALSTTALDFRSMRIPPGSDDERRRMISQDLSDSGDFVTTPFQFDFWNVYSSTSEPEATDSTVNVIAVTDELATQVSNSIRIAGLDCQVLDGGPFPQARSLDLIRFGTVSNRPAAILDWGHNTANFAVVIDSQPAFSRSLKSCGVGSLVGAVQEGLGVSIEDCHEILSTSGVVNTLEPSGTTELQDLVTDFAGSSLDDLVAELQKTLSFLRNQRAELLPERIWLAGGGATIHHIAASLSHRLGLPVETWRHPLICAATSSAARTRAELLVQAAALSDLGFRE